MPEPEKNVVPIHPGDLRISTLYEAMLDLCYERANGMSIATIGGVLDMVKYELYIKH